MTSPAEKTVLRSELLLRRSTLDGALRKRVAARLAEIGVDLVRGFASPHQSVASAYYPMRGEADPLPLLDALTAEGIATALPVTVARASPLRFLVWQPGEALRRGTYGVMEPLADNRDEVPDVLFVPLAGFDARGFRLGYGAGYYDATLADLRRRKRVLAVGVAFAMQEVAVMPAEPHDERLDAVVTEHGLRFFETR